MKYFATMLLLLLGSAAWANARIDHVACQLRKDALIVDVSASLVLPDDLANAVKSGLNLELVYDIRFKQTHSWWPGQAAFEYRQRLSYNPISQQFILETPNDRKRLSFAYLNEALAHATHIRNLAIGDLPPLKPEGNYQADIRLRLDKSKLPVSLRLDAFFRHEWHIESEWSSCQPDR